jgi:hypothetical protein
VTRISRLHRGLIGFGKLAFERPDFLETPGHISHHRHRSRNLLKLVSQYENREFKGNAPAILRQSRYEQQREGFAPLRDAS